MNGEGHKLVGQQLIDAGLITPEQLAQALERHRAQGGFLGKVLIDMNLVTEDDLAAFLVRQCRVPHIRLTGLPIPEEALRAIPKELAYRFRLIPIDRLGKVLSLAMVNPMDQDAVDIIKETTGLSIRPFICTNSDIDMALRDHYGEPAGSKEVGIFKEEIAVEETLESTPEAVAVKTQDQAPEADSKDKTGEEERADGILVPDYTFATFVVGNGNDFTHAISRAVAESPGTTHNPVYIHGSCGLGKTHLLHAIGNEIKRRNPAASISYRTLEEFVSELIEAIQLGRLEEFRRYYTQRDALLLDDIQFLAGKERAQEEFVRTFEEIYAAKKQIVITGDRPPQEIQALKEKLRTRFESGIITDIRAPDVDTRHAILKSIAKRYGTEVPDDVLALIAGRIDTNVRELEGCLKKLIAFSSITDQPVTKELAEGVLARFSKASKPDANQAACAKPAPAPPPAKPAPPKVPDKAPPKAVHADKVPEKQPEVKPVEKPADAPSKAPAAPAEPSPEARQRLLNIRKDFGELLKTKLQKSKNPEELKSTLISLLTEAKGLFQKKGDPDFAAILAHAVELAESGDVKNAIVVTAKACKG